MGFLSSLFAKPKPLPTVVLRNVLGEVLLELPGRPDLTGANLNGLNLAHVDLSGMSLWGANLEGTNLMGARLVRTSFWGANLRGADVSYSDASSAHFQHADLTGASLYRSNVDSARFDESLMDEHTDIPGRRVTGLKRVSS